MTNSINFYTVTVKFLLPLPSSLVLIETLIEW